MLSFWPGHSLQLQIKLYPLCAGKIYRFGVVFLKQQVIRIREEAGRCLLCHEPKCGAACPRGVDVGRIVRALLHFLL